MLRLRASRKTRLVSMIDGSVPTVPPGAEAPQPTYEISRPTAADIPRLLELWQGQYDYHHQHVDPVYYAPFTDELRARVEADLPSLVEADEPHVLVAREGDNILGFITFEQDEDTYYDANIKQYGVLKEAFVTERARSQGIGEALVHKAEDHFRDKGINHIMIQCSSENKPALALYERLGYIVRQKLLYKEL